MGEGFTDYLDILDGCLVCPRIRQKGMNGLIPHKEQITVDHVVPKGLRRAHKDILDGVIDARMNQVTLCREDHDLVEKAKTIAHAGQSFVGLIIYICELYPRSLEEAILRRQAIQWEKLMSTVKQNIDGLNGNVAPHFRSGYSMVSDLIERHLDRWAKYGFS